MHAVSVMGDASAGASGRQWPALFVGLLTCIAAHAASAADCPGHPNALGTSRTLVVDPREHPRIGTMQYAESLPLRDHEVVLTFDDGPLPRNSNQILAILASQCVKATFFTVGRMALAFPEGVRRLVEAGHSVGTHSQNHPLTMDHMPIELARQEIDEGIAAVKSALADGPALAPFFRIPGLRRAEAVEDYLAAQGIQIWSADFPADDWRHISSSRVYELAMKRLEDKGKGILLLHDIQARTVAALPRILSELKVRGYRVVHVVSATPLYPATPTGPQEWQMRPASEKVALSHWPKIPTFVFAETDSLPAPAVSDFSWPGVPLLRQAPWPRQSRLAEHVTSALPLPPRRVEIWQRLRARRQGLTSSHRAKKAGRADHEGISVAKQASAPEAAGRGRGQATHGLRGSPKHLVQVRKRSA